MCPLHYSSNFPNYPKPGAIALYVFQYPGVPANHIAHGAPAPLHVLPGGRYPQVFDSRLPGMPRFTGHALPCCRRRCVVSTMSRRRHHFSSGRNSFDVYPPPPAPMASHQHLQTTSQQDHSRHYSPEDRSNHTIKFYSETTPLRTTETEEHLPYRRSLAPQYASTSFPGTGRRSTRLILSDLGLEDQDFRSKMEDRPRDASRNRSGTREPTGLDQTSRRRERKEAFEHAMAVIGRRTRG